MPKGPQGQKRPADAIGRPYRQDRHGGSRGRRRRLQGPPPRRRQKRRRGAGSAANPGERSEIAKKAAANPDEKHVSTSYVERMNLSIRMQNRRFTRLTNAFSKKLDNHIHALTLYFAFYNFCRIHKTLKMSPAMAAGVSKTLWSLEDIAERIKANRPQPGKRGPYKKAVAENSN